MRKLPFSDYIEIQMCVVMDIDTYTFQRRDAENFSEQLTSQNETK